MKIIHVIPSTWGPFVDIRAMYQSLARRAMDIEVVTFEQLSTDGSKRWVEIKRDPENVVVCWNMTEGFALARDGHLAKLGLVYSEAMDDNGGRLLSTHLDVWHCFKEIAPNLDFVFVHTPWMKTMIERAGRPTYVLPVGWDAEAMGSPREDAAKHRDIVYWGSMCGRREVIVPGLGQIFGDKFKNISGNYGRQLLAQLDNACASLYVAHSSVRSFSTWRLWQGASSSAIMFVESNGHQGEIDCWPFMDLGAVYPLPEFTIDNMHEIASEILEVIRHPRTPYAANAHEIARKFNIDYVYSKCLLPAIEEIRSR